MIDLQSAINDGDDGEINANYEGDDGEINDNYDGDDGGINDNEDGDGFEDQKCYSINYHMVPTKIAYFLNGARIQLDKFYIPFLVSIGFNLDEAGLIAGLQSIGGIIGAPAWGFVADKFRIHKILVLALCVLTTLTICIQPVIGIFWGDRQRLKCPFQQNQTSHNNDDRFRSFVNHYALFYSMIFIGIIARSFDASLTTFIDTACLRRVQTSPKQTSYGRQRFVFSFGLGFGIMVYSIAVQFYPTSSITSCETGVFVIYFGISIFLFIGTYYLFNGFEKESEGDGERDITRILRLTLRKFDTIFFFATALFSGIIRSIYFSFIYLRLKEINAIPLLFGFQAFLIATSGSVMSYFAAKVIKFLGGTMHAICCSLFVWSLRFLCVSYITNPYYIFLIEIFHGLTASLFLNSAFVNIKENSHPSTLTFMSGTLNSLFGQCGLLIANIFSGKLYHMMGVQKLFLLTSGACAAWGILVLYYLLSKRFQKKRIERLRRTTLVKQTLEMDIMGSYANHITNVEQLSPD